MVWPELGFLAEHYRSVFKQAEGIDSINEMARIAYRATRMLTCAPASPRSESTGLTDLVERCAEFVDKHPVHSIASSLTSLRIATENVLLKPSPIREQVIGAISEYGVEEAMPWKGQPEVVLVVPPDLVPVSQEFLAEEELETHVKTPEQLKQRRYRGLIICGNIETAFRTYWTSPETAARMYGWLVTAPPADRIILVETPISSNRVDHFWLLRSGEHQHIEVNRTGSVELEAENPSPLPPPPSVRPATFAPPAPGEKVQSASQILLASERSIFFANGVGSQPRLVLVEEGDAETKDQVPISRLSIGDYLVIRASGSDYEEVKDRAERELTLNRGWTKDDITRARGLVMDLKHQLQRALDTKGERSIREAMMRDGLPRAMHERYVGIPSMSTTLLQTQKVSLRFLGRLELTNC